MLTSIRPCGIIIEQIVENKILIVIDGSLTIEDKGVVQK